MDFNKTGGPMRPTLNGAKLDDNTFRFEGLTVFDYFVGQLLVTGMAPASAIKLAADVMELRTEYLKEES